MPPKQHRTIKNGSTADARDIPGAGHAQIQTLTGDLTLTDTSGAIQIVDCNGAHRNIILPPESVSNHPFYFINISAGAYNAVVKNDAAVTKVTVAQNGIGIALPNNGTAWYGQLLGESAAVTAHVAASAAVHGLPANVNVLGNRTAAGEFIQHAAATTGAAESAITVKVSGQTAVSFPVAFGATPIVFYSPQNNDRNSGCVAEVTTAGFKASCIGENPGSEAGAYIALGT